MRPFWCRFVKPLVPAACCVQSCLRIFGVFTCRTLALLLAARRFDNCMAFGRNVVFRRFSIDFGRHFPLPELVGPYRHQMTTFYAIHTLPARLAYTGAFWKKLGKRDFCTSVCALRLQGLLREWEILCKETKLSSERIFILRAGSEFDFGGCNGSLLAFWLSSTPSSFYARISILSSGSVRTTDKTVQRSWSGNIDLAFRDSWSYGDSILDWNGREHSSAGRSQREAFDMHGWARFSVEKKKVDFCGSLGCSQA